MSHPVKPRCSVVSCALLAFFAASPGAAQRQALPSPARTDALRQAAQAAIEQAFAPLGIAVPKESASAPQVKASELRIAWDPVPAAAGSAPAFRARVVSRVKSDSPFPRLRTMELAEGTILVAALTRSGVLVGWSVCPDPRVVRVEVPGPDGVLTGRVVQVERPEFLALVPDDPSVVEVRLLEPVRSTSGLVLRQVAAFVF
jgi:hypothetical protein